MNATPLTPGESQNPHGRPGRGKKYPLHSALARTVMATALAAAAILPAGCEERRAGDSASFLNLGQGNEVERLSKEAQELERLAVVYDMKGLHQKQLDARLQADIKWVNYSAAKEIEQLMLTDESETMKSEIKFAILYERDEKIDRVALEYQYRALSPDYNKFLPWESVLKKIDAELKKMKLGPRALKNATLDVRDNFLFVSLDTEKGQYQFKLSLTAE